MANLMTLAAYAATHGASKQAASKWKTRGLLVLCDEMVDAEASDVKMEGAAKGRFRTKAHGGRRQAGVQGSVDRPGLTKEIHPAPFPVAPVWSGWHRVGNPNALSTDMRALIDLGDAEAISELLDTLDFSEWENACTAAGWDRWPASVAALIAADLGIADIARVQLLLETHVRARLTLLGINRVDLTDPRLDPR
ncbi:MAG TPA: hypothetical protein VF503_09140 [Sphingobium sp.]|uniref:hypothetical protein n=1 Tax=Sphingobium sp. TaxID=1912891 RepID=UPI002ED31C07